MNYLPLSDPKFDKIASLMPDCCVLEIHEIENEYNDFEVLAKNKKVIQLFHGTKHNNIHSIIEEGLKTSYNKVSAYGKGVYFSDCVKFSMSGYTDISPDERSYVFLCDVIESEVKKGSNRIFVCPNDNSHRVKYLISFYKLAK